MVQSPWAYPQPLAGRVTGRVACAAADAARRAAGKTWLALFPHTSRQPEGSLNARGVDYPGIGSQLGSRPYLNKISFQYELFLSFPNNESKHLKREDDTAIAVNSQTVRAGLPIQQAAPTTQG